MANIKKEVELHIDARLVARVRQLEDAIKPVVLEYRGYLLERSVYAEEHGAGNTLLVSYIGIDVRFLKALDDALESGL